MRNLIERIHTINENQLEWPFENYKPQYRIKGIKSYDVVEKVDPFPCYGHDCQYLRPIIELVEQAFPIGFEVDYYLPQFETESRTNGFANRRYIYINGKDLHDWEPYIVLQGKRIPIHPAMSRYLIGHEYGHIVRWWIEHIRGIKDEAVTELDKEYMDLRPGSNTEYGGRKWDSNVGEIFANDFRIIVCGLEIEFWPHYGFPRPLHSPKIIDFWTRAKEESFTYIWDKAVAAEKA